MESKRVTRRGFLKGLAAATAATALAACKPEVVKETVIVEKSVDKVVTATPLPVGSVKLNLWRHVYAAMVEMEDELIGEFQELNPAVEISTDSIPFGDMDARIATAFAAGNEPDMMCIGGWTVGQYVEAGLLATPAWEAWGVNSQAEYLDLFESGTEEALMYQGKAWGYPREQSLQTTAFRTDHFEEAGLDVENPPATWEEWAEVGKDVIKFDAEGNLSRMFTRGWWPGPAPFAVFHKPQALLRQVGGGFVDKDGTKSLVNTPESLYALKFMSDTIHEWKLWDPAFKSPDPAGSWDGGFATYDMHHHWVKDRQLAQRKAGFIQGPSPDYRLQHFPHFREGSPMNFHYTWLYVVNQSSQHKDDCWKFIEYSTRWPGNAMRWHDRCGFYMTRKGLFERPEVKGESWVPFYLDEYQWSERYPRFPKYGEISSAVARGMQRITAFPPDPVEQVAADLEKELNGILQA